MKAKILIVGGGIMGTSIALHAAKKNGAVGDPVVLLERGAIGDGSSGRSGAILRMHYHDRVVAAIARDSLRYYASFESRTGRSIGFRRTGVLTLAGPKPKDTIERLKQNVEMLAEMGAPTSVVSAEEIRNLVPGIQVDDGAVGAWEPESGSVDPMRTLEAFGALARTYGASTRLGVELQSIEVKDGKVRSAETSEGSYEVEQIVIAAGPWSRRILERLDVHIPLRTIRPENHFVSMNLTAADLQEEEDAGAAFGFDVAEGATDQGAPDPTDTRDALAPRGLHPVIIDLERAFYARCEPSSRRTRIGRTEYGHDDVLENPDELDENVSEDMRDWSREVLSTRLPNYKDQADAGSIAAWYTLTPDAQAIIGPAPGIQGLYLVTGFSGHGFKLAPSIGQGVAQALFDEPINAFAPEFFATDRFKENQKWTGRFGL